MSNTPYPAQAWQAPVEIDPTLPEPAAAESAPSLATATEPSLAALASLRLWPRQAWAVPAFLCGVAALVLVALAFDAADLMGRSFATSYALGVLVTVLLAVTVGSAIKLAIDEMLAVRRLREIDGLRAKAAELSSTAGHGEGMAFVDTVGAFYGARDDLSAGIQALRGAVTDAHSDGEIVSLIDRQLLTAIDQRAYACVLRASRDTAIATALSPSAALDVAIVLWRNLKLVREVATLYGARPGRFGSWRLMRRMLANLAVAEVTDSVGHAAIDALGGSLAAAVSTRLGQGMLNGLLTARIGLASMNLCRPVTFAADNQPSLRRIRTELLSVPKAVL